MDTSNMPIPGSTDTVPALLTPGEIVMNKEAVDLIGKEKLLKINHDGLKIRQTGIFKMRPSGYMNGGEVKNYAVSTPGLGSPELLRDNMTPKGNGFYGNLETVSPLPKKIQGYQLGGVVSESLNSGDVKKPADALFQPGTSGLGTTSGPAVNTPPVSTFQPSPTQTPSVLNQSNNPFTGVNPFTGKTLVGGGDNAQSKMNFGSTGTDKLGTVGGIFNTNKTSAYGGVQGFANGGYVNSFTPDDDMIKSQNSNSDLTKGFTQNIKSTPKVTGGTTANVSSFTPSAEETAYQNINNLGAPGGANPGIKQLSATENAIKNPPLPPIEAPHLKPGFEPKSNLSLEAAPKAEFQMQSVEPKQGYKFLGKQQTGIYKQRPSIRNAPITPTVNTAVQNQIDAATGVSDKGGSSRPLSAEAADYVASQNASPVEAPATMEVGPVTNKFTTAAKTAGNLGGGLLKGLAAGEAVKTAGNVAYNALPKSTFSNVINAGKSALLGDTENAKRELFGLPVNNLSPLAEKSVEGIKQIGDTVGFQNSTAKKFIDSAIPKANAISQRPTQTPVITGGVQSQPSNVRPTENVESPVTVEAPTILQDQQNGNTFTNGQGGSATVNFADGRKLSPEQSNRLNGILAYNAKPETKAMFARDTAETAKRVDADAARTAATNDANELKNLQNLALYGGGTGDMTIPQYRAANRAQQAAQGILSNKQNIGLKREELKATGVHDQAVLSSAQAKLKADQDFRDQELAQKKQAAAQTTHKVTLPDVSGTEFNGTPAMIQAKVQEINDANTDAQKAKEIQEANPSLLSGSKISLENAMAMATKHRLAQQNPQAALQQYLNTPGLNEAQKAEAIDAFNRDHGNPQNAA